ncbi:hypothetical protein PSHT_03677 [Puccinia striiformis]|uniref:Uncharacterized protein n=2 Tax=Puccinia striiformis TaxID=27350 RepID=A0A2S4WEY9_9BASI|nr:hypothetical protein PSTT_12759 [Puccinia striiformis]POW20322.1 hypothetical protein PSHT_03677 [Puccinia striiformis]
MDLLSLIIYLSCSTTPALLADGGPSPEMTVLFTCVDSKELPSGWCVSQVEDKLNKGYNFSSSCSLNLSQ